MPRRNRTPRRKRAVTTDHDGDRPISLSQMAESLVERGLASSAVLGPRPDYRNRTTTTKETI